MADGITGVVHLNPEEGEKVRGAAAGLGTDKRVDRIARELKSPKALLRLSITRRVNYEGSQY
ncbi:hypothetical protein ACGLFO_04690, partial [Corynebacterium hesseae]